ncbi:MAG: hypothetical protein ABIS47_06010 [Acidimicrobiales bacterium]
MRIAVADDLEAFVESGALWDPAAVEALVARLDAETAATGDPLPAQLARPLGSVLWRLRLGPVPTRLAADIEAVAYPRLWKVLEAVRQGLPDGELRIRIEVMGRRLSRRFADEVRPTDLPEEIT